MWDVDDTDTVRRGESESQGQRVGLSVCLSVGHDDRHQPILEMTGSAGSRRVVALYKTLLGLLHNVTVTSITFKKVRSKQKLLLKYNLLNCSNLDFGNPAEVGLVPWCHK